MQPIRVMVQDTAADTDALSGTDLERAPGPGILSVWCRSSVTTATLTAVVGGKNILRNQVLPASTNGQILINEDPPAFSLPVSGGEKVVVNIGGTTGTVHTLALFEGDA